MPTANPPCADFVSSRIVRYPAPDIVASAQFTASEPDTAQKLQRLPRMRCYPADFAEPPRRNAPCMTEEWPGEVQKNT